ncbi:unnamed protein product [Meganyctiphanes norvegica]|uniref:Uncharacterized protein n=1 Tax=Meganyctiphanes norvegica TaxID=48144 RepID=A0AAV2RH24_MEGNR
MSAFTKTQLLLFTLAIVAATVHASDPWLSGGKCGPKNPLSDGRPGQCNPQGKHPCCNPVSGWCGNSTRHCTCTGCTDYRKVISTTTPLPTTPLTTTPAETPPPPPPSPPMITTVNSIETSTETDDSFRKGKQLSPGTTQPETEPETEPETDPEPTAINGTHGHPHPRTESESFPDYEVTGDFNGAGIAGGQESKTTVNPSEDEGYDTWIGLVIALCVVLIIGVGCLTLVIRNKRMSASQNIQQMEDGSVNGAFQTKEKETTLSFSNKQRQSPGHRHS